MGLTKIEDGDVFHFAVGFFFAEAMSVMTALCGSFGSSSPKARPAQGLVLAGIAE